jgi:hypothetical protein
MWRKSGVNRRVSSTLRQPAWEFSDFRRLFRATDQVAC